jgi:hypothetical protein
LTAKSILVLIADQANDTGYGFPSAQFIAEHTEVSLRTVLRTVQIFEAMGLIVRTMRMDGKPGMALQLAIGKLRCDLRDEFKRAHADAQGKAGDGDVPCLTDMAASVSETVASVCETQVGVSETVLSVSETVPPHPLIGVPLIDPLMTQTPPNPLASEGEVLEFTAEQRAHLESMSGNPGRREFYEGFYRAENERTAAELARAAAQLHAVAEEMTRLQDAIPTVATARVWVMHECGFVEDCRRHGIGAVIDAVLELAAREGRQPWETGPAMARAWRKYQANGEWISPRYGPVKFFKLGIWRDERGWGWKVEAMRKQAEARAGSVR